MSDLQIGLIVVGILLIVVVLALNWWQDRRVQRRMQQDFAVTEEDPLLGGQAPAPAGKAPKEGRELAQRREPAWVAPPAADVNVFSDGRREPAVAASDTTGDHAGPDAATEAVINLVFAKPVPAETLLPLVRDFDRIGQKPVRIFYRSAKNRQSTGIRLDDEYVSLHLAVLLANRSGALNETEWAQAWAQAQRIADQLDAEIEGPDPRDVTEMARQLDEICAALDTSVGLTLMPQNPQPWRMTEILDSSAAAGFTESADGERLEWRDANGAVRFTLAHRAPDTGRPATALNLLLDVPRSPASDTAFADMARVARQLAEMLDAGVVDDNDQPLAEGSETAVDAQLRKLYADLARSGLPAGSARALRVFA